MQAVITAGSQPSLKDPLYQFTQGGYKALLEIAGKPMIQWIIDALNEAGCVSQIVVIGLPRFTGLDSTIPLTLLPDSGGLVANVRAGLQEVKRSQPEAKHVMLLSSDVPGVTAEMLNWLAARAVESDKDLSYLVIEKAVMEKRYPGSRRTFLPLKDVEVCGGDVLMLSTRLADDQNPVWDKLIASRKSPLQQAALLGYDTLFMILLRQMTLEKAGEMIGKRLGITARALLCPFAEMGMDVDKPHQFELMTADLSKPQTK